MNTWSLWCHCYHCHIHFLNCDSVWLLIERLNIWTFRPLGLSQRPTIHLYSPVFKDAIVCTCACVAMKGHFGHGRMNTYVIRHPSPASAAWLNTGPPPEHDTRRGLTGHEGWCWRKGSVTTYCIWSNREITSTPAFCQVTPGDLSGLHTAHKAEFYSCALWHRFSDHRLMDPFL